MSYLPFIQHTAVSPPLSPLPSMPPTNSVTIVTIVTTPHHPNPVPHLLHQTPPSTHLNLSVQIFFSYKGFTYLIHVDHYSNWPIIERSSDGTKGLINSLGCAFATCDVPEELATDGGPEFEATLTKEFLQTWGVHHRLSSVAFPHSNSRAKVGSSQQKRIITNNTRPNGCLDVDAVQRAPFFCTETPDPTTKLSPAFILFGRPIRDFISILPG